MYLYSKHFFFYFKNIIKQKISSLQKTNNYMSVYNYRFYNIINFP